MINSITMVNFRKHRQASFSFGPGLVVIRGPNESSKSTVLEAIGYALFGVKALRTPLDEVVAWGEPVGSLKVELELTINGVTYNLKRAKSGCECNYDGGIVTGQTEVSNFMGSILRMDVGAAQRLVISSQKEIAGALEAGPKATTELIERLAEFDQIDRLLELMQEKLTLGSDATAQAALASAEQRLDEVRAVSEPDFKDLELNVALGAVLVGAQTEVLASAQALHDAARDRLTKVQAEASERASLQTRADRLQERHSRAMAEMQELKSNPVNAVSAEDADAKVEALGQQKAEILRQVEISRVYAEVSPLCGEVAAKYYPGTAEELDVYRSEFQRVGNAATARINGAMVTLATLRAGLSSGNCGFCGQDFSALPSVKEKNDELQAQISGIEADVVGWNQELVVAQQGQENLVALAASADPFRKAASRHHGYLELDESTVPPVLSWVGGVHERSPGDRTVEQLDAEIQEIKRTVRAGVEWAQKIKANDALLESFNPERDAIKSRLAEMGEVVTDDEAGPACTKASTALQAARTALAEATTAHNEVKAALRDATRDWERSRADLVMLETLVATNRAGIKDLVFNNLLLKRVRAARPVIADRLWNLVLTSVSSYFSEMRGTPSIVTKNAAGFQIDEKPVESFSGSTIDVLGLAIRVALVRTFLPTAPFLLLDEPAAAMDGGRTESTLGFITGSGFGQVILCSHDPISESVCDSVIYLGAEA